uniref:Uncharacterized protein n=1 Tax=Oryza meridionalis TaxID=40149 RepID=A0A0E0C3M6_9ORYZ
MRRLDKEKGGRRLGRSGGQGEAAPSHGQLRPSRTSCVSLPSPSQAAERRGRGAGVEEEEERCDVGRE